MSYLYEQGRRICELSNFPLFSLSNSVSSVDRYPVFLPKDRNSGFSYEFVYYGAGAVTENVNKRSELDNFYNKCRILSLFIEFI